MGNKVRTQGHCDTRVGGVGGRSGAGVAGEIRGVGGLGIGVGLGPGLGPRLIRLGLGVGLDVGVGAGAGIRASSRRTEED